MALNTNVQVPRWLENIAKPVDLSGTGEALGTLFAGGLLGMTQPDEDFKQDPDTGKWVNSKGEERDTQPKEGFRAGLTEARMNQQNPMWKLHVAEQKQRLLTQAASLELQHAELQDRNEEKANWLSDVQSGLPKWLSSTPMERDKLPRPDPKSRLGLAMIEKKEQSDEQFKLRSEIAKSTQESRKTAVEQREWQAEHGTAWQQHQQLIEEGLSSADDATRKQVWDLPNHGRDPQRKFLTPDAEVLINNYRKLNKIPPIGTKVGKDETAEPKTTVLKDGTVLAWMPGGNTLHVIKPSGDTEKMTLEEARKTLTSLQNSKADKATIKLLTDFIASKVSEKMTPIPKLDEKGSFKVGKYTVTPKVETAPAPGNKLDSPPHPDEE